MVLSVRSPTHTSSNAEHDTDSEHLPPMVTSAEVRNVWLSDCDAMAGLSVYDSETYTASGFF